MALSHKGISQDFAQAKINLTLHVGAAISSGIYKGYHPVDSLVVFADVGDELTYDASVGGSQETSLEISGPYSKDLKLAGDNLVLKAAQMFFSAYELSSRGRFRLVKNLPLASGIGGGSADAAAALRLLAAYYKVDKSALNALAVKIGADVSVCLASQTAHMLGIGEAIDLKPGFGAIAAVLVNPGFAVSTADIFKAFDNKPSQLRPKPQSWGQTLYDTAISGGNDLQAIATSLRPEIQGVIDDLSSQEGCRLARMSGSGATCFGLFETQDAAKRAARDIKSKNPHYWCCDVILGTAS